jgi:hypothetical protein
MIFTLTFERWNAYKVLVGKPEGDIDIRRT